MHRLCVRNVHSLYTLYQGRPVSIVQSRRHTSSLLKRIMHNYENITGIAAIQRAQSSVLSAEEEFVRCQELRRDKQQEINEVNQKLRELHDRIEKVNRSDDRYLELVTAEHALIKQERGLAATNASLERSERDLFARLSNSLRASHEQERLNNERTKYWSLIGSGISAVLAFVLATIANHYRMAEFRSIVSDRATGTDAADTEETGRLQAVLNDLAVLVQRQHDNVTSFVTDLKKLLLTQDESKRNPGILGRFRLINAVNSEDPTAGLVERWDAEHREELQRQYDVLSSDLSEIKQLIALKLNANQSETSSGDVVYVGPKMEDMLDSTESSIEWKMKVHALAVVAAIYAGLAVSIPLIAAVFGGSGT